MPDDPLAALELRTYRLHESSARRRTVAGIHVNVPAPKALWTVVCVTIAMNRASAVSADKILFRTFKPPCHYVYNFITEILWLDKKLKS
jgi:gamma-glutamylcysteine synthetase